MFCVLFFIFKHALRKSSTIFNNEHTFEHNLEKKSGTARSIICYFYQRNREGPNPTKLTFEESFFVGRIVIDIFQNLEYGNTFSYIPMVIHTRKRAFVATEKVHNF